MRGDHRHDFTSTCPDRCQPYVAVNALDGKYIRVSNPAHNLQQELPRIGMASRDVFPHPEQGRADGQVLWILQQCLSRKKKEAGTDDAIPCILDPVGNSKAFRKNWARLIQKIYEVDTLVCPKCKGNMQIISFIEDAQVIRDILTHLGLWLVRSRPPPKINDPPIRKYIVVAISQQTQTDTIYSDPEYTRVPSRDLQVIRVWDQYIET